VKHVFADIATATAHQSGRPITFLFAVFIIIAWAVTGPIFHYSDTWQLIINTGTTIVTFLMVFIIQNTQNRDGAAVQAKLDELIRVSAAQNALIGIEQLTEDEISEIRDKCAARAKRAGDGAQKNADKKARAAISRIVSWGTSYQRATQQDDGPGAGATAGGRATVGGWYIMRVVRPKAPGPLTWTKRLFGSF